MRTPEMLIKDIHNLEEQILALIEKLAVMEKQELESEPAHRKMTSELMNADFISKLPNQTMRDDALENYILNNAECADKHFAYLLLKMTSKNTYRLYRYLEECMKNRRAELQTITFGGERSKEND